MAGRYIKQETESGIGKSRRKQQRSSVIANMQAKISALEAQLSNQRALNGQIDSLHLKENGRLRQWNVTLTQQLHDRSSQIEVLEKELAEQRALEQSLRSDVTRLNKEMSRYKEEHDVLIMSQAVCLFEQSICSFVLPEVYANTNYCSLHGLLGILNGNEMPQQLQELTSSQIKSILDQARKNWVKLCDLFKFPEYWKKRSGKWRDDDYRLPYIIKAIGWLKKARIDVAHPVPIVLKGAEDRILSMKDTYMYCSQYHIIKRFILSLRDNMDKKSELRHPKFMY